MPPPAADIAADQGPTTVPLSTLRSGACATVRRCMLEGQETELLSAMGLRNSCRLRVCRAGEPCIVQVDATRLGLSKAMARLVMVDPSAAER